MVKQTQYDLARYSSGQTEGPVRRATITSVIGTLQVESSACPQSRLDCQCVVFDNVTAQHLGQDSVVGRDVMRLAPSELFFQVCRRREPSSFFDVCSRCIGGELR